MEFREFKRNIRQSAIRFFASLLTYFLLLLPTIRIGSFSEGADIRIAAFLPICLGTIWKMPAAFGIFAGNLLYDYLMSDYPFTVVLIGSLSNGFSAVLAGWLYKKWCANEHDLCISNARMVLKFIAITIICELPVAVTVAALSRHYLNLDFLHQLRIAFLNNLHNCLYFGLPFMIFIPRFLLQNSSKQNKGKIGTGTFATAMMFAVVASLLTGVLVFCILMYYEKDFEKALWITYQMSVFINILFIMSTAAALEFFEMKVVRPLLTLSNKLKRTGDEKLNEIEILNRHIDFAVSSDSRLLSSDHYSIYVGLTSQKTGEIHSVKEAREIINEICLKHVSGYTSTLAEGGYKGESEAADEKVLIYSLFGATDEQIESIVREITKKLAQEAVLVEKNDIIRYYCYAPKEAEQ